MKNAFVISHHYGDDGNAPEGRVLYDVAPTRFAELQKAGLVREATADEAKAGTQPAFESEAAKMASAPANKKAPEPVNKAAPRGTAKADS